MRNKFKRFKGFIPYHILSRIFIFVYIPIIILLISVLTVSLLTGIPIGTFTKDPAVIAGKAGVAPLVNFYINPFLGIISNLGILLLCACASVCLFASFLTRSETGKKKLNGSGFLKFFGLLSLGLLFDDLFLFHESIAPKLLLSQEIIYIGYIAIVLFGIIKFRKVILKTEWFLLCFAFAFFVLSLTFDLLYVPYLLLEDGFKLLGIATWCSYFVLVSLQVVKNWSCSSITIVE